VQSREMLAYRSALLDAAVSKGASSGIGEAMARILEVLPHNIRQALETRATMAESRESQFALHVRRKRTDILDSASVAMVEL
jgi:NADP-dependent 3-hydroxy acid dehydrogenase YdfG